MSNDNTIDRTGAGSSQSNDDDTKPKLAEADRRRHEVRVYLNDSDLHILDRLRGSDSRSTFIRNSILSTGCQCTYWSLDGKVRHCGVCGRELLG